MVHVQASTTTQRDRGNVGGNRLVKTSETRETSADEVLADAVGIKFDDQAQWEPFQQKHIVRLNQGANDSVVIRAHRQRKVKADVLHELLLATARKGSQGNRLDEYQNFVEWAIKHHRPLLKCRNKTGRTPLHVAIEDGNHEFVKLVLENAQNVGELLCLSFNGQNCLHRAIVHRSPFTKAIIAKFQDEAKAANAKRGANIIRVDEGSDLFTTVSLEDEERMTPLHIAAEMERFEIEEDEEYRFKKWTSPPEESSRNGIPRGTLNTALAPRTVSVSGTESPIKRSHPRMEQARAAADLMDKLDKALPNSKASRQMAINQGSARDATEGADHGEQQPHLLAPQALTRKPTLTIVRELDEPQRFDLSKIIRELINARPRVLVDYEDNKGNTPFQTRLAELARAANLDIEDDEASRRKLIESDEILRFMREYIIENFDRKDAMKALYKNGDGRVLEFDLFGLPYPSISAEFLEGLRKVLRFEGLLKYVALPRLAVEACEGLDHRQAKPTIDGVNGAVTHRSQESEPKGKGLQDMCDIFRWLKNECGVSSVLKVTVIDDGENCHSDEAIEACMEGLEVRSWNWYRVDLCCDVILNSASRVKDVALYSSGNNAVLKGWSSPSGLAKLKNLEKVHIILQKGLERQSRLEGYMKTFESEIRKHKPEIKLYWSIQRSKSAVSSLFTDGDVARSTEPRWMQTMMSYGQFLRGASRAEPGVQPVKIAIIDDGINPTLSIFTDRIRMGESFHSVGESLSGRRGAFYVPSGPHGTLMAQLICKICPTVKLYIAQLEVFRGQDGRRSFSAESAAEAIAWAVKQGVDIISMSWYIKEGHTASLDTALRDAVLKNIVLFCSSIDEGATSTDKTYPSKVQDCIKIGASTDTGARLSWVSADSDFLLPGDYRHGSIGDDSHDLSSQKTGSSASAAWAQSTDEGHGSFGSSVSTALAAGLAGTLLFSDRLYRATCPDSAVEVRESFNAAVMSPGLLAQSAMEAEVEHLRRSGVMKNAFDNLSVKTEKFPQVWDHFPSMDDGQPLAWDEDDTRAMDKVMTKLGEFVRFLKK